MIDTRKHRPGGTKCKVLLIKTSIMGHGLWSKETSEVPSPHTSFTTRPASEENTDFLHLVNEDTDGACLLHAQETNCNAGDRAAEQPDPVGVDALVVINTQNNNLKVTVTAKIILLATTFCFRLMQSGNPGVAVNKHILSQA